MKGGTSKHGVWGNGAKRDTVKRTGFTESTVTEPAAKPAPGEAPPLKYYADPWYAREPFDPAFKRLEARSAPEAVDIERAHTAAPKTKIPTLPPFK